MPGNDSKCDRATIKPDAMAGTISDGTRYMVVKVPVLHRTCRDAELDEALRLAGCDPATFLFDSGPDESPDLLADLACSCKQIEALVTLRWLPFPLCYQACLLPQGSVMHIARQAAKAFATGSYAPARVFNDSRRSSSCASARGMHWWTVINACASWTLGRVVSCRDLINTQPMQLAEPAAAAKQPVCYPSTEASPPYDGATNIYDAVSGPPVNLLVHRHSPLRPSTRGGADRASKASEQSDAGLTAAVRVAGGAARGSESPQMATRHSSNWLPRPDEARRGAWQQPRRDEEEVSDAQQVHSGVWAAKVPQHVVH